MRDRRGRGRAVAAAQRRTRRARRTARVRSHIDGFLLEQHF